MTVLQVPRSADGAGKASSRSGDGLATIKGDTVAVKWMLGFVLALQLATLVKQFNR